MTVGKDVGIRISPKILQRLDATCAHYRWRRSQAVAEYVNHYDRLMEAFSIYRVVPGAQGQSSVLICVDGQDEWRDLREFDPPTIANEFAELVNQVQQGLLASFREPLDLDALEDVEEEES